MTTDNLQKVKDNIMDYLHTYPQCMNIEIICDLGISKEDWNRATKELQEEGKIGKRIKWTYSACRNPDGSISNSGMVYHEKGCNCGHCKL